jgi:hypothetical protein
MTKPTHLQVYDFHFNQHGYKLREVQRHSQQKNILTYARWENASKDKIVLNYIRDEECEDYMAPQIKGAVDTHVEGVKKAKHAKAVIARRKTHLRKWNV